MAGGPDNRTVLVVDDHDDIRKLMSMSLQMRGCQVVEATDGKQAVELAAQFGPRLILMDLSMPVLDGYEATRRIRALPELRDVPIVAVSAYCDAHNREKALAAGCVECVGKPVDFGMIDGLLQKHMRAL